MARGLDRVDGELAGRVLQPHREDGVDARVGVFDLHIEVGERSSEWNVFLYRHFIFRLVECWRFIIDITNSDCQIRCSAGTIIIS